MKKFIPILAAALVSCSAVCVYANAEDQANPKVYVTISDGKSDTPVLIWKDVTVTDIDNDGSLTINDALYIAHEENFTGGAAEGYKSAEGQYGLGLKKLWGVDNGDNYGYYVDNKSAFNLADKITDGSYIGAFVYTDNTSYSDSYSWFDKNKTDAKQGDELELTLSRAAFDSSWNPITLPVEGAVISINGEATEVKTDAEGKAKVKIDKAGQNIISAKSDKQILVPPVCVVNAAENAEITTTTADTTTTSADTATTTESTSSTTSTVSSSTSTSSTTAAATTTAKSGSKNDSPKTGNLGAGTAVFVLGTAVCTAFALRKKHE